VESLDYQKHEVGLLVLHKMHRKLLEEEKKGEKERRKRMREILEQRERERCMSVSATCMNRTQVVLGPGLERRVEHALD
jgi:hypothetical protein